MTPFVASAHFSIVAALRCEIQAVDQHWSQHRLAINLSTGKPDPQLAEQFPILEPWNIPVPFNWPQFRQDECRKALLAALELEAGATVKSVKDRQSKYLQRELATVDRYYDDYSEALARRLNRTRSDAGRSKMEERLKAAQLEHHIRRIDQIKRHEIRVHAHVDALLRGLALSGPLSLGRRFFLRSPRDSGAAVQIRTRMNLSIALSAGSRNSSPLLRKNSQFPLRGCSLQKTRNPRWLSES
jgi:hypothetical protein